MRPEEKIFSSLQTLAEACAELRAQGKTLVLTSGCFDILHRGHVEYLYDGAELGYLIVGLNSDAFVRRLKGPERPFRPEYDRVYTMAGFEPVHGTVVFDDDVDLLRAVRPHVYVVHGSSNVSVEEDPPRQAVIQELGIRVVQLGEEKVNSTTAIAAKMRGNQG